MPTITDAAIIGTKNAASLLLAVLLYVLTIWIPYLNVGTTIAMNTIPSKLAQGEVISPFFIFDSVYRRKMGSFFLLEGMLFIIMFPAFWFMIIPAIVLSMMYSLSLYIMLDKDTTPTEALELSNKATYGFKWKMFGIILAFCILAYIICAIFMLILNFIDVSFITFIVAVALIVIIVACGFSLDAVIYRNLYLRPAGLVEEAKAEPTDEFTEEAADDSSYDKSEF